MKGNSRYRIKKKMSIKGVTIVGCLVLVMLIYHSEAHPFANILVLCVKIMRGSPQIQISIEHGLSLTDHTATFISHKFSLQTL